MIFRQIFDSVSSTYTYLLASRRGGEALIIDPVLDKVDRYIQLLQELDLKLVKAVDTTCMPITSRASARCATARAASP
jgi:glyoxylase-like metal-dependent hydrolase (beta-lactamase superfamily II)